MNTKTLSEKALSAIDQYLNFTIGNSHCSIPYFNNRHKKFKGQMRVYVGKGSPKDILEEIESISIMKKIDIKNLESEQFKKFLVGNDIGIDCSGLAYYILNEESKSLDKGTLDKHLSYPLCKGLIGKIRCKLRPVENIDVVTLAHDSNSKLKNITQAEPGDMITMINNDRNHILIIHQIEYQNFMPVTLHYTHAIAWPIDGEYGHGVRQGRIDIVNPITPITEQRWIENTQTEKNNYTLTKAQESKTELRRLNYL